MPTWLFPIGFIVNYNIANLLMNGARYDNFA